MNADRDPLTCTVHYSDVKAFSKSALAFVSSLNEPRTCTPAMRIGTAQHRIILGGPTPPVYDGERKGNAWKDFVAANSGWPKDEIMTISEMDKARSIGESARNHPTVRAFLERGRTEVPLEWRLGKVQCATRGIDILSRDRFGDLKTVPSVRIADLTRHCECMGYHVQLAWYDIALNALGYPDRTEPPFLLCVEAKAPHDVVALTLAPATLEKGRMICHAWMEELNGCRASGVWPGVSSAPVEWHLWGADLALDDSEAA